MSHAVGYFGLWFVGALQEGHLFFLKYKDTDGKARSSIKTCCLRTLKVTDSVLMCAAETLYTLQYN